MDNADRKVTDFKQRVEKEWAGDDAAAAWQKHYPQMRAQLAQVTDSHVEAFLPHRADSNKAQGPNQFVRYAYRSTVTVLSVVLYSMTLYRGNPMM